MFLFGVYMMLSGQSPSLTYMDILLVFKHFHKGSDLHFSIKQFFLIFLLGLFLISTSSAWAQAVPVGGVKTAPSEQEDAHIGPPRGGPPTGFFYGVGLIIPHNLYGGKKNRILPIPMIGYLGERLKIFGPNISYAFLQDGGLSLNVILKGRFDGFDANDSELFVDMEKRSSSADAGLGLGYEFQNWRVDLSASRDILGKSNGSEIDFELGKQFAAGQLSITPSIGITWQDAKLVDYYYGVRAPEAIAGRALYTGTAATNYRVGLAISKPLFGGSIRANIGYHFYHKAITNSPLVDKNSDANLFLSYTHFF